MWHTSWNLCPLIKWIAIVQLFAQWWCEVTACHIVIVICFPNLYRVKCLSVCWDSHFKNHSLINTLNANHFPAEVLCMDRLNGKSEQCEAGVIDVCNWLPMQTISRCSGCCIFWERVEAPLSSKTPTPSLSVRLPESHTSQICQLDYSPMIKVWPQWRHLPNRLSLSQVSR